MNSKKKKTRPRTSLKMPLGQNSLTCVSPTVPFKNSRGRWQKSAKTQVQIRAQVGVDTRPAIFIRALCWAGKQMRIVGVALLTQRYMPGTHLLDGPQSPASTVQRFWPCQRTSSKLSRISATSPGQGTNGNKDARAGSTTQPVKSDKHLIQVLKSSGQIERTSCT